LYTLVDVSELLPLTDILFIPRMINEYGERWWNETEELQKNLPQCHFFHHKSHMD
jgi:hypothetical protein